MYRGIITDVQRNLAETLDLCGKDALTNEADVNKICEQILAVIKGKHPCQTDEEEDEEEDIEEFSEYDWLVIETAMDVLVGLAKALREHFAPLWQQFEKPVLKHVSSEEGGERAAATGTVAECIRGMGKAVTPYTHALMKIAIHRMGDEDIVAKANAIYAAGMLCQFSGDTDFILKQYSTILRKLEPQLSDDASGHLLDNAAGCVARMIIAYPDKVPLDEVLPVLINLTPAKEDYEVNSPLYECIVLLCRFLEIFSFQPKILLTRYRQKPQRKHWKINTTSFYCCQENSCRTGRSLRQGDSWPSSTAGRVPAVCGPLDSHNVMVV